MSLIPYGEKTNPPVDPSLTIKAPQNIMAIFKRSCFDCHSNQTQWPWYSSVFPLSWSIYEHVKNGRASMNFNKWNSYSQEKQEKLREAIARKVGTIMPLKEYLWFHSDAKITKKERQIVQDWAYAQ
jgi:hypothetical protein